MDAFQKLGAKYYGIWSRNMKLGKKREIGKDRFGVLYFKIITKELWMKKLKVE